MPNYAAMKTELPKLKSGLTRAKNSGSPIKVREAVERAVDFFDDNGWPDAWATWKVALGDAKYAFQREARHVISDEDYDEALASFERVERRFR